MIKIKNSKWTAEINPIGAELSSLKNRKTGEEFIWQRDPAVWAGSAPVLFPMVGILANGVARFKGQEYALPKHGLVRGKTFERVAQTDNFARFRFKSSAEMARLYPFAFTFEVEFQLETEGLTVTHRVLNNSAELMPFNIGGHPAIALDLERYGIEDYFIEFNRPETLDRYRINAVGLCDLGQKNI